MTIKEFLNFAKDCKTKPELASLAKSNGLDLTKDELDKIFQKITSGAELGNDALEAASGGAAAYENGPLKDSLTQ